MSMIPFVDLRVLVCVYLSLPPLLCSVLFLQSVISCHLASLSPCFHVQLAKYKVKNTGIILQDHQQFISALFL